MGIDWTFASLDEAAAHTLYGFAGRAVAVAVSLGGVCVTALLLGIVSEQISHWIEDLKRGRSEVGCLGFQGLGFQSLCWSRSATESRT